MARPYVEAHNKVEHAIIILEGYDDYKEIRDNLKILKEKNGR
jgi:hypothetical protein